MTRIARIVVAGLHDHVAQREAVSVQPLGERTPRFADLIESEADEAGYAALRGAEAIGRPLGAPDFLAAIAHRLGRAVAPRKRGRKPGGAEAEGEK